MKSVLLTYMTSLLLTLPSFSEVVTIQNVNKSFSYFRVPITHIENNVFGRYNLYSNERVVLTILSAHRQYFAYSYTNGSLVGTPLKTYFFNNTENILNILGTAKNIKNGSKLELHLSINGEIHGYSFLK